MALLVASPLPSFSAVVLLPVLRLLVLLLALVWVCLLWRTRLCTFTRWNPSLDNHFVMYPGNLSTFNSHNPQLHFKMYFTELCWMQHIYTHCLTLSICFPSAVSKRRSNLGVVDVTRNTRCNSGYGCVYHYIYSTGGIIHIVVRHIVIEKRYNKYDYWLR